MASDQESGDNNYLWERLAKTVERTYSDKIPPILSAEAGSLKAKQLKASNAVNTRQQNAIGNLPIVPKITAAPSDLRSSIVAGLDGSTTKKIRSGKFSIEATLDLHGLTQSQAHQSLNQFISKAVKNDLRMILIITGKGISGNGVLRNQVPIWLKSSDCSPHILAFSQAQAKDGGNGALYVRLRRKRVAL